ncbi:MAG: hypothetical protein LBR49_04535 [Tannerella sp.]|nr:hypothetical protein [Tannerella sp.]
MEEALGVCQDSAYRRIRGETELSYSELRILHNKFNLSMEDIFGKQYEFIYMGVNITEQDNYIRQVKQLSDVLAGVNAAADKEVYYTAQDIPLYYFTEYTDLLLFKLYVWSDAHHNMNISFNEFCNNIRKKEILPIFEQVSQSYINIPTTEIWTNQTVDKILRPLDYYARIGIFDKKKTIFLLLNQLTDMMATIRKYADNGYRGNAKVPFSLYNCSIDMENNFILARKGNNAVSIIKVNNIATCTTTLCNDIEKWINSLIVKSTLISKISIKERHVFFQTIENKIKNTIHNIELMDYYPNG